MKRSKLLALLLSLTLIAGSLPMFGTTVLAAETPDSITFNAQQDFSLEQNSNGVWRYQYSSGDAVNGYTFTDLPLNGTQWGDAAVTGSVYPSPDQVTEGAVNNSLFIYPVSHLNDAVLTFTAPYSGVIILKMANGAVFAPATRGGSKAARLIVRHNDKNIRTENIDGTNNTPGSRVFEDTMILTVKAGDTLRFMVGRNIPEGVYVTMNPEITYTQIIETKYNAFEDYSTEKNPNGVWSYVSRSSSENEFTLITQYANGSWQNSYGSLLTAPDWVVSAEPNAIQIGTNDQTSDVALAFTAPFDGKINIRMTNGGVYAPQISTPGVVRFNLIKNTETLRSFTVYNYNSNGERLFADTMTLDVRAGDKLYFAVGRNEPIGGSIALFNPEIEYIEYGDKTVFTAVEDYSDVNNPSGVWSYQDYLNGVYTYDIYNAESNTWQHSTGFSTISYLTNDQVTGKEALMLTTHNKGENAVVTFTSPYSGEIAVSMANGGVFAPTTNHGVNPGNAVFTMTHNEEVIRTAELDNSVLDFFNDTVTLTVSAGDTIRFKVDRLNGGWPESSIRLSPRIEFLSVYEETGRTFYIDSVSGSDSYLGTSEYAPWQSLSKLADIDLGAGDSILLKRGSVWNTQLILNNVRGTEQSPVVIGSYGEGEQPKIDLGITDDPETDFIETATPCVLINNSEGLEINDLYLTGSGIGIDFYYKESFNNEYIKISNCTFKDLTGFAQPESSEGNTGRYGFAGAVCVSGESYTLGIADPLVIGLFVDGCVSEGCGSLITYAASPSCTKESRGADINGLFITNCTMRENDYYGTFIGSDGFMSDCTITDCGQAEYFAPGTTGIMISAKNFAVINTEISGQKRGGVPHDGCAIDFEHLCENVTVENCYIHDNEGVGVMFYDSNNANNGANVNCTVKNNVFSNNAGGFASSNGNFPSTDIWVTYGAYYSLEDSTITGNRYYNSNPGYQFFTARENAGAIGQEPQVPSVIENNTSFDPASEQLTYLADKAALLEDYRVIFEDYNTSGYTVDKRTGKQFENAVVSQDIYSFSEEFSSNMENWDAVYYLNGWQNMQWDPSQNYYSYQLGGVIGDGFAHPSSTQAAAFRFTAPKTGRVLIDTEDMIAVSGGGDGVVISLLDNDLNLICDPITLDSERPSAELEEIYLDVNMGDSIYFYISKRENNANDYVTIRPRVSYVYCYKSLNGDDIIDILDLITLKKAVTEPESSDIDAYSADIDGATFVTAVDLVLMRKYLMETF